MICKLKKKVNYRKLRIRIRIRIYHQNKNFYMRNNSTCRNNLYLGIFYHFKPKTQKIIFDKKIR